MSINRSTRQILDNSRKVVILGLVHPPSLYPLGTLKCGGFFFRDGSQ